MSADITTPAPTVTGAEVLGRYSSYVGAQHLVDRLSDAGFPVQHLSIVGDDLQSVERVTGRMTVGRAALLGGAQGAWMGLVLSVLFALITPWAVSSLLLTILVAAIGGAIFGAAVHASTGGVRDFTSTRRIEAGSYAVLVATLHASAARALLGQQPSPPPPVYEHLSAPGCGYQAASMVQPRG
jgi:hypothetical protein